MRYPSPYSPMLRPMFPPRPPGAVGIISPLMRPPIHIIRPSIVPPAARPLAFPIIPQPEKPQTTVYVGKISSTAENEFMLSLLQLCGPVRSWKRAQDPTNGSLKGFGFCEFESAEGVLRALRLLNKLSIDGQALMLNVNQATRDYLERYVGKKVESSKKPEEPETEGAEKEEESASSGEKNDSAKTSTEPPVSATEESKKDGGEDGNKENLDSANFGLITDEDRQSDKEAVEKLKDMIEERLKNKPLPPPPPPPQTAKDGPDNSNIENARDGERDREDKNEDEMVNESKTSSEQDKAELSSPDHRRYDDRRNREQERDLKREKERELERYEREREQERAKREYRIREDERRYKAREKDWESRERERDHLRKREREREKEKAQERKWDILEQERDGEDGYRKRKHRTSDEERKRRQREKEDDLADRFKEEEEIAEAKRRADEEQQKKEQEEALKILSGHLANGREKTVSHEEDNLETQDKNIKTAQVDSNRGEGVMQNGTDEESVMEATTAADTRHNNNAPAKRLGFGLQGSGKRAAVPSVFNADEDEDAQKEKKMRPLVPIDYSADDQHMVEPSSSEAPPAVAADIPKRTSNKEERSDGDKHRHRRTHEKHDEESYRNRDESRNLDHDRVREPRPDKVKMPDNQKLLDAKQLIDMIPKTKDELFSYEINWATYDKNALHERMRPWISKKITDFLGEEEPTLVDYIVSNTQEHVKATEMLDRLSSILDDEAEMFVLKMWRMLIFEIKKVETGLARRPKP